MKRLKSTLKTIASFSLTTLYIIVGSLFYAADRVREIAQIAAEIGEVFFLAVRGVRRDQMTYWQKTIFIHYLGFTNYMRVPAKNTKLEQIKNTRELIQQRVPFNERGGTTAVQAKKLA